MLSGDDFSIIKINPDSGVITFNHWNNGIVDDFLNYVNFTEIFKTSIKFPLIFLAEDNSVPSRFAYKIAEMSLDIVEWSGSAPFYPLPIIHKVISESTKIGSVLFSVTATNKLNKMMRKDWKYSLIQTYPTGSVSFF